MCVVCICSLGHGPTCPSETQLSKFGKVFYFQGILIHWRLCFLPLSKNLYCENLNTCIFDHRMHSLYIWDFEIGWSIKQPLSSPLPWLRSKVNVSWIIAIFSGQLIISFTSTDLVFFYGHTIHFILQHEKPSKSSSTALEKTKWRGKERGRGRRIGERGEE